MAHWGYKGSHGPANWHSVAPSAAGSNQSPVVIERKQVKYDVTLKEKALTPAYDSDALKTLLNNGHAAQINVDGHTSHLSGGPLSVEYTLKQFHFHWGSKNEAGSEHVVDTKAYSAELHLVHWNSSRYATFEESVKAEDGLAVLTVFLEVKPTNADHPGLKVITDLLPKIIHCEDTTALPAGFNPTCLLPDETAHYWTYHGSLTTPPCLESVQFIIYEKPIEVSESQMELFRALNSCKRGGGDSCSTTNHEDPGRACRLVDNYRPTMALNARTISASFECSDVNQNV